LGEGRERGKIFTPNAMLQKNNDLHKTYAKKLRINQTSGEKALWRKIRAKRFYGYKFRRQVPIEPYIVDFICLDEKLIIEIDGYTHFEKGAKERDQRRENYLCSLGFKVVRFKNRTTVENIEFVLSELKEALGVPLKNSPLPNPLPSGEGDEI
jgi:very-short-patch-repair endonuclease